MIYFDDKRAVAQSLSVLGYEGRKQTQMNLDIWTKGPRYYNPDVGMTTAGMRGYAPNTQTGDLRNSIKYKVMHHYMTLQSGGTEAPYAYQLEEKQNRPNLKTVYNDFDRREDVTSTIQAILIKNMSVV